MGGATSPLPADFAETASGVCLPAHRAAGTAAVRLQYAAADGAENRKCHPSDCVGA